MAPTVKWTKHDERYLEGLISSGNYNRDIKPAEIRSTHMNEFGKYTAKQFSNKCSYVFNKHLGLDEKKEEEEDDPILTHVPGESVIGPNGQKPESTSVTPYNTTRLQIGLRNGSSTAGTNTQMNLLLPNFVSYFVDENNITYAVLRIVLPSGQEYLDISHHLKYFVEKDGMSFKVHMNMPPCLDNPVVIESMWMNQKLEGAFTARMRQALLLRVRADVLAYKTSLGLTNGNEQIAGTITIPLKKPCETAVVLEFLCREEREQGVMLNVVLKCKVDTISVAEKKKIGLMVVSGEKFIEERTPSKEKIMSTPMPYAPVPTSPMYPTHRSAFAQDPSDNNNPLVNMSLIHARRYIRQEKSRIKAIQERSRINQAVWNIKLAKFKQEKKLMKLHKNFNGMGKGKIQYDPYTGNHQQKMSHNPPSLPTLLYDVNQDPLVLLARQALPGCPQIKEEKKLRLAQKKIEYAQAVEMHDMEYASENDAKAGLLEIGNVNRVFPSFPTNMDGFDSDDETAQMDNHGVVDLNASLFAEEVQDTCTEEDTDGCMDDDASDASSHMSIGTGAHA